jgi:hypothetical protein
MQQGQLISARRLRNRTNHGRTKFPVMVLPTDPDYNGRWFQVTHITGHPRGTKLRLHVTDGGYLVIPLDDPLRARRVQ